MKPDALLPEGAVGALVIAGIVIEIVGFLVVPSQVIAVTVSWMRTGLFEGSSFNEMFPWAASELSNLFGENEDLGRAIDTVLGFWWSFVAAAVLLTFAALNKMVLNSLGGLGQ